jgi:hypothetical protein
MGKVGRGHTLAVACTLEDPVHMFTRFMHTAVSRIVRACIGWALVVEAVYQPIGIGFAMMAIGTVIAVLAIADVCVLEQMLGATRQRRVASPEPREHPV